MKLSVFSKFLTKNWDFSVNTQIAWLFAMTYHLWRHLISVKRCVYKQRTVVPKLWQSVKEQKFKAKKIEGGGCQFDPPPSKLLGLIEHSCFRTNVNRRFKAQFRRRASAVPNLIQLGSTVARQKYDCDSDVVPESYQIQDFTILKPHDS